MLSVIDQPITNPSYDDGAYSNFLSYQEVGCSVLCQIQFSQHFTSPLS